MLFLQFWYLHLSSFESTITNFFHRLFGNIQNAGLRSFEFLLQILLFPCCQYFSIETTFYLAFLIVRTLTLPRVFPVTCSAPCYVSISIYRVENPFHIIASLLWLRRVALSPISASITPIPVSSPGIAITNGTVTVFIAKYRFLFWLTSSLGTDWSRSNCISKKPLQLLKHFSIFQIHHSCLAESHLLI